MGRGAILNGVLGLIVALLAVEIARTWARGLPAVDLGGQVAARAVAPEEHEPGKRRGAKAPATAEAAPPILVAAIEAKDLFDPSRQTAAVEEVKVAPPPPKETAPPSGVAVVGLRLFGSDREAFVTDSSQTQGSPQRRLRIGDQIGGYNVTRIDATEMVLTSPAGDEVTLPLVIEKGKATPPPPGRPVPVQSAAAQPAGSPTAGISRGTAPAAGVPSPRATHVAVQDPPGQEIAIQRRPGPVVPGRVPAQAAPPAVPPAPPPDIRNRLEKFREHPTAARIGRNTR